MQERFFKKVKKNKNGCWIWTGYKNKKGYGSFWALGETLAHRFSFKFFNKKDIPEKMLICHTCDNPSCVNPKHLWLGSPAENNNDCIKKGRAFRNSPKGEKNGMSKLSISDVYKIKELSKTLTQKEISKMFNCTQSNISYLLSNKTWNIC